MRKIASYVITIILAVSVFSLIKPTPTPRAEGVARCATHCIAKKKWMYCYKIVDNQCKLVKSYKIKSK